MKTSYSAFKRIVSLFLVVCMLVAIPQIVDREVSAYDEYTKVADPSTMDSWEKFFGPNVMNTENAGTVWTDKSVFTSAGPFSRYGIGIDDPNGFLTALSVMASTKEVSGYTTTPTDTMLILDLSSSMYDRGQGYTTVQAMANAVNTTITDLLNINVNNRVGVCVYFGGPNVWDMPDIWHSSLVLLPLGRYKQAQNKFFDITANGSELYSFNIAAGVTDEKGVAMSGAHIVPEIAGTNMQWGLLDAWRMFSAADTTVPMDSPYQPGAARLPVFVLMTDGKPTAASSDFTKQTDFELGHNSVSDRHPAQTDFLTQLTAAYVKEMADMHYKATTPLFYTLSLGNRSNISDDITNPSKEYDARCDAILANPDNYTSEERENASVNDVIRDHWYYMVKDGGFAFDVLRYKQDSYEKETVHIDGTSVDIGSDKGLFPWSEDQRFYVDQAFSAAQANNLADAFGNVVEQIAVQSKYLPTFVEGDEDEDGYISFVDNIGKYMKVSDVKGIALGDRFFSGAELASNFRSYANVSQNFEAEMIEAVKIRLGITSDYVAQDLIGKAYNAGQLGYKSNFDYSNYIGWYANASGQYLGFWDGTEAGKNNSAGATYVVKSYGYLGYVDDSQGVVASDMMYAVVQLRQNIQTGEQTMIFSVPAALVPMVTYDIRLDKYDGIESFEVTGADAPMSLIYEVSLDDDITPETILDGKTVDSEYLRKNTNSDGSVNFYTNAYEVDNSIGYGKVNATSNFRPAHQNEAYYFQEDSSVYVYQNGQYTEYVGNYAPSSYGEYYYRVKVYYGGYAPYSAIKYKKLSDKAIEAAKATNDGTWYVPAGAVHVEHSEYILYKSTNATNTLKDETGRGVATVPFVDIEGHGIYDISHNYVAGATLGNNGKLSVLPSASLEISKTVEGEYSEGDEFVFRIVGTNEGTARYSAIKTNALGVETETTVSFTDGRATVSLKHGESILIVGLANGNTYEITEEESSDYVLKSVNGNTSAVKATVTVQSGTVVQASFVNVPIEKGDLSVTKVVEHNLGDGYQLTHDREFDIVVRLSGEGVQNATFRASCSGDSSITSLTTNASGVFPTVKLKDGQTLQIFDIPAGVVATVVENNLPEGFTASYRENNADGDGVVSIINGATSVTVVNSYKVEGEETVTINGTKELIGKELVDNDFTFVLENKADGTKVNKQNVNGKFEFILEYTEKDIGKTFEYELYEINDGKGGITYDASVYTIEVTVSDNGNGGITVQSAMTKNGNTVTTAEFVNSYTATGKEEVIINGTKELVGKELVDNDFIFVLKNKADGSTVQKRNINGKFEFILEYTEKDIGKTFEYELYEMNDGKGGITYDASVYVVEVTVSDNGNGGITVQSTMTKNGNAVTTAEFVNSYEATGKEEVVINGTKELVGKELVDNDFTFVLENKADGTKVNKQNVNGKFEFILEYTEKDIGKTFEYELYEMNDGKGGITYDASVYVVEVTVSDNGNGGITVQSTMTKNGNAVTTAEFVNSYEATGKEEVVINGTKELVGKELVDNDFTFVLENKADGTKVNKQNVNGKFEFILEYTEKDIGKTFEYELYEINDGKGGITYDASVYTIEVTVSDNGNGGITVQSAMTKNGNVATTAEFVNSYEATGREEVVINGTKELIGKELVDNDFTFVLENKADGTKVNKQNVNGKFEFILEYTEKDIGKTFEYELYEMNGGDHRMEYDSAVYVVVVTVSDDADGGIVVSYEMTKDGENVTEAKFRNVYTPKPDDITVDIGIDKTVENLGTEAIGPEGFEFVLEAVESGEKSLVVSDENGKAKFTLTFGEADIGKIYTYKVYEVEGNVEDVIYSTAVYEISISVSLGEDNKLTAAVTKNGAAVDNAECEFENVYDKTPPPKPGDTSKTIVWTIVLVASGVGCYSTYSRGKKKEEEEQDA